MRSEMASASLGIVGPLQNKKPPRRSSLWDAFTRL
jgi:hypothetical protein